MNSLSERIFKNKFDFQSIKNDLTAIDSISFEEFFEQIIKNKSSIIYDSEIFSILSKEFFLTFFVGATGYFLLYLIFIRHFSFPFLATKSYHDAVFYVNWQFFSSNCRRYSNIEYPEELNRINSSFWNIKKLFIFFNANIISF